ncbi:MAG: hypothetical protein IT361_01910 [Gemmatimonadaceae bacterium]|nr:hypothetical protein [Gemmatimonadaceae bacterium]
MKIEKLNAALTVTATPLQVNYLDSIVVTASVSPGGAGGIDLPWTIDSTRWVPAFGTQTSPCAWSNFLPNNVGATRLCKRPFTRSGTLTVFATVNGDAQSGSVTVVVLPPKLKVTATPNLINGAKAVTFKRTLANGGGYFAPTWTWRPVTGISSTCPWNLEVCTRTVSTTGWMVVKGTFDGYTLSDSAKVTQTNCVTGDSILDNESIRTALMEELFQSSVDSAPPLRLEQAGFIYRLPDGSVQAFPWDHLNTACSVYLKQPPIAGVPAGSTLIGTYHSHPVAPGELVYDCQIDGPNGLPITGPPELYDEPFGHAGDWYATMSYDVPDSVITKGGWVYRLDYPPPNPIPSAGTTQKWLWNHGSGSQCTWSR